MEETAGSRLKDRGGLDVGRGGREGSRRECTNDAQDLSRTYGLFRRPLSAQREGGRSIYAKQSASCIIYMHSACTWMRESRYVAMNACARYAGCLRIYIFSKKKINTEMIILILKHQ